MAIRVRVHSTASHIEYFSILEMVVDAELAYMQFNCTCVAAHSFTAFLSATRITPVAVSLPCSGSNWRFSLQIILRSAGVSVVFMDGYVFFMF